MRESPACLNNLNHFTLVEGCLYYVDPDTSTLHLVAPEEYRKVVFHERHGGVFGTHLSARKVYVGLLREFYWANMRGDCEKWSRECPVCAYTREPRRNLPPLHPIETSRPFELVCMDVLKLGLTSSGNRYLLVIIDHFSKWVVLEPLPTKTQEDVARVILERLILVHGAPTRIHSDKGKEFVNQVISHLQKLLSIDQSTTAGYNPRANGATERLNRDIIKDLKRSCIIPQEWDHRAQYVAFSHNISVHESTGETPFYTLFGRDPCFPSAIDPSLIPSPYCIDIAGFKEITTENLARVVERVRMEAEKAREDFKRRYDEAKKVTKEKYRVGQRVMLRDPRINSSDTRKLHWRYHGPYRVLEIVDTNAKIRAVDHPNGKTELVPLDRLSPIPDECVLPEGEGGRSRAELIAREQRKVPIVESSAVINRKPGGKIRNCAEPICRYTPLPSELVDQGIVNLLESTDSITKKYPPASMDNMEVDPVGGENQNDRISDADGLEHLASSKARNSPQDSPVTRRFVALVPSTYLNFCDGPESYCIHYEDNIEKLAEAISKEGTFHDTDEILLILPRIGRSYMMHLSKILQSLGQLASSKVYVVPPPPVYNSIYENIVDELLLPHGNVDSNMSYRGRTILSYGWVGNSLNQHEANEGYWTKNGLKMVKKFLVECIGIRWPFVLPHNIDVDNHAKLSSPPAPIVPATVPTKTRTQPTTTQRPEIRRDTPPARHSRRTAPRGGVQRRETSRRGNSHYLSPKRRGGAYELPPPRRHRR